MDSGTGKRPEPLATDGISIVTRVRRRSALPGHPSVALGWKLSSREVLQFTAEKIRQKRALRMFVTYWSDNKEAAVQRTIVRRLNGKEFVLTCHSSGNLRVKCCLVVGMRHHMRDLEYYFLSRKKDSSSYRYPAIEIDAACRCGDRLGDSNIRVIATGCVVVDIDGGLFRSPADWEFVNSRYALPPQNRLAFWRRRAAAYLVLPLRGAYGFLKENSERLKLWRLERNVRQFEERRG